MDRTSPVAPFVVRRLDRYVDLLPLHRANPQRYPFLLESSAFGPRHARYDILFAFPGRRLALHGDGTLEGGSQGSGFLAALDDWWRQESIPEKEGLPPFRGGWFLFLGYELAAEIEPRLRLPAPREPLPVAVATRIHGAIIRDHLTRQLILVAEESHASGMARLVADLESASAPDPLPPWPGVTVEEEPPEPYLDAVARAKRYVVDGDIFQANLSRGWFAEAGKADPVSLYRNLRLRNPAPFAGLARFPEGTIISSSPERLVAVRKGWVETRPIAGTRPRGDERESDRAYSRELLSHPKERAEHVMLIDLERNDLGRISRPGTVEVNELMVLESFAHVHHIVSNIRGRLQAEVTPGAVIRAVFPGGTITGCPKVRCMEIIAELEGVGRGAYTGSMGYLNRDGTLDLNILIRTLVMSGESVRFRAGAGIVADSVAERELKETRAKAKGLLLALGGPVD